MEESGSFLTGSSLTSEIDVFTDACSIVSFTRPPFPAYRRRRFSVLFERENRSASFEVKYPPMRSLFSSGVKFYGFKTG